MPSGCASALLTSAPFFFAFGRFGRLVVDFLKQLAFVIAVVTDREMAGSCAKMVRHAIERVSAGILAAASFDGHPGIPRHLCVTRGALRHMMSARERGKSDNPT
jgi:hypothetical protein